MGALTCDDGLHEESEHGEHGQAAVLDLLDLELSEGVRVVSQAQGVEGATCSMSHHPSSALLDTALQVFLILAQSPARRTAHEQQGI